MNAPDVQLLNWTDANQQFLSAELARIKALLRGEPADAAQEEVEAGRAKLTKPAAIDSLTERFGLSSFERDVLLLAAGVEMDSELAALCAAAGANGQRAWASFGLALAVLPKPHWSALTPIRPLRQWRLIEIAEESAMSTARLRIDERVLHYLAGVNFIDVRLQPLMRQVAEPAEMADSQVAMARDIVAALEQARAPLPIFQLSGRDEHGKCDIAAWVAAHLGLNLYAMAGDDIPAARRYIDLAVAQTERYVNTYEPFAGREAVNELFWNLFEVFEDFRYADELEGEGTHALIFRASVHGKELEGLDLSLIHISEPTRLLSISYAVFCLKKKH